MKLLSIIVAILLSVSIFSQTNTFRLGFTGTYPQANTYSASQNANYIWYNELSMNFWQGHIAMSNPEHPG